MEESIHRALKEAILRGEIAPGQRLLQEEIADYFGCSRVPARDALKRLEADGLVSAEVKGRYSVVEFTEEDAAEIFDLRELLEPYAARSAVKNLRQTDFEELRQLNETMRATFAREDYEPLTDLNFRFHMLLYGARTRPRINRILSSLWLARPRLAAKGIPQYLLVSFEEHDAMISLAEAGNLEKLEDLVRKHVQQARGRLAIALKDNQETS